MREQSRKDIKSKDMAMGNIKVYNIKDNVRGELVSIADLATDEMFQAKIVF